MFSYVVVIKGIMSCHVMSDFMHPKDRPQNGSPADEEDMPLPFRGFQRPTATTAPFFLSPMPEIVPDCSSPQTLGEVGGAILRFKPSSITSHKNPLPSASQQENRSP